MNLAINTTLAEGFKSKLQITRILTEDWVLQNSYCPSCGMKPLKEFENNRPVADFYCIKCSEEFELKSKREKFSNLVPDGAYQQMTERINSDNNPNFFFLSYTKNWNVKDFFVIPKQFFTNEIIIRRKPLSEKAKRAGWIGCNIDISKITELGKVYVVKNSQIIDSKIVNQSFIKTLFLRELSKESKGWTLDIMACVDAVKNDNFTLKDIYKFEEKLKIKYPNNNFIKDKIRQQLQNLRDKGIIEFVGRGSYKKVKNGSL